MNMSHKFSETSCLENISLQTGNDFSIIATFHGQNQ